MEKKIIKFRLTTEQFELLKNFNVFKSNNKTIYHIPHYFVLNNTPNAEHEMLFNVLTIEDLLEKEINEKENND